MNRRHFLISTGGLAAAGAVGTPAAFARRSNNRRREATLVELEPGDVEAQASDPDASNFEEAFTYWVVRHGIEYDVAEYREPARTGPDVYELAGSDVGSYWFGVSAPDGDGIQHPVDHRGQVALYLGVDTTGDGEVDAWYELRLQFDGQGRLRHVNGVEPA